VNPAANVRDAAAHGMGLLLNSKSSHLAESALPALVRNLKDKEQVVRADTASALVLYLQMHAQDANPDLIIPALIENLHDNYSWARLYQP